jgi:glycosyltransferase involved in cell wall biosynthesis
VTIVQNRKVLIVSYLFPPNGGIAVQRALSFAKYLPRLGYEVHVLTAQNASGPVRDPGLMKHIPPEVTIHHAFAPEVPFQLRQKIWAALSGRGRKAKPTAETAGKTKSVSLPARLIRRVLCPEPEILWVPFALRKMRRLVRELGIGAVLITVPPFSALVAGTKLKREFPSVNFISDFRDEWLSFYLKDFEFQSGGHTRRRAEKIERECVEASDMVVAVTPTSLEEIRRRYPEQPDRKFVCVPNGYDPEVFADVQPPLPSSRRTEGGITITHVGTVYSTATPKYFLDAVDAMPDDIRPQLTIQFIGRISESERQTLEARKCNVKALGFMPQAEALKRIERTDYLLLNMTNDISLPGKLFEYFATGRPILALSPPHGEVARIIAETGTGWCVSPYDAAGIQGMVLRALDRVKAGAAEFPVNWDKIRRYERPRLAELLSQLMQERLS